MRNKQKTYEAWEYDSGTSIAFGETKTIESEFLDGLIPEGAKLLHIFVADSWEEAVSIHHELMGWEPYEKMEKGS